MREIIVHELTQATQELVREFARFLPRLMVMLIVVLVGWMIAYLVKAVLRSILRLIKFDKLSEGAGASQLLSKAALPSSTSWSAASPSGPPGSDSFSWESVRLASWACRNT